MRRTPCAALWTAVLTVALVPGLGAAHGQADSQSSASAPAAAEAATIGKLIYTEGAVARSVTACAVCHGENGRGADALGIPGITGQTPSSTLAMLRQYKNVPDFKLAWPNSMHIVTAGMTDAELEEVSAYVASMPVGEEK